MFHARESDAARRDIRRDRVPPARVGFRTVGVEVVLNSVALAETAVSSRRSTSRSGELFERALRVLPQSPARRIVARPRLTSEEESLTKHTMRSPRRATVEVTVGSGRRSSFTCPECGQADRAPERVPVRLPGEDLPRLQARLGEPQPAHGWDRAARRRRCRLDPLDRSRDDRGSAVNPPPRLSPEVQAFLRHWRNPDCPDCASRDAVPAARSSLVTTAATSGACCR
jgi:hypothetical protein